MPYRTPWIPNYKKKCECLFAGRIYCYFNCCKCNHENDMKLQFCKNCGHARDLEDGETDECLIELGLAQPSELEVFHICNGNGYIASSHSIYAGEPSQLRFNENGQVVDKSGIPIKLKPLKPRDLE